MTAELNSQILRLTGVFRQLNEKAFIDKKDFKDWFNEKYLGLEVEKLDSTRQTLNVKKMRSLLEQLKEMSDLFGDTVEDINSVSKFLQDMAHAAIPSKQKGIGSMPNDALSSVFEHLKDDYLSALHISQVCKRFRKVSLGTPILWSVIRQTKNPLLWKLFLKRSKKANLTVHLENVFVSGSNIPPAKREFFKSLGKESSRWEKLYIDISVVCFKLIVENFRELSLPKLEWISMRPNRYSGFYIKDMDNPSISWFIPQLKHFQGYPIPPIIACGNSVLSCEIYLTHSIYQKYAPSFFEYLMCMESCRAFKLFVDFTCINLPLEIDCGLMPQNRKRCLPNIKSFTLSMCVGFSDDFIHHLLDYYMPTKQLETLTLELYPGLDMNTSSPFSSCIYNLPSLYPFDELKALNIVYKRLQMSKFSVTVEQMPKLEHISVNTYQGYEPTLRFSNMAAERSFPKVKTITFRNCKYLTHEYLVDLAKTLTQEEYDGTFEKLVFFDCALPNTTKNSLKNVLKDRFDCHASEINHALA